MANALSVKLNTPPVDTSAILQLDHALFSRAKGISSLRTQAKPLMNCSSLAIERRANQGR